MSEEIIITKTKHPCIYIRAWVGKCGKQATGDPPICEEHKGRECWCGKQATRECHMASSFVCGRPTCSDHECNMIAGGMTGSHGFKHSKKGHQQFQEWKKNNER